MSNDNRDHPMVKQLFEVFSGEREVAGCLTSRTEYHLQIYESTDAKISAVFEARQDVTTEVFRIENPLGKIVYFLAVDRCFFKSYDPKRCDCIVFDDYCFCFIELKLEVMRRREGATRAQEARAQLVSTIDYFRNKLTSAAKDFLGYKLEAYVVMRPTIYPRRNATREIVFERFQTNYGVRLFEQNWKEFGAG